ncbi:MAG: DUF397 domain-containing protein [Pseudonocardiaceae bacterium]
MNCVEVADLDDARTVRDRKSPAGPALTLPKRVDRVRRRHPRRRVRLTYLTCSQRRYRHAAHREDVSPEEPLATVQVGPCQGDPGGPLTPAENDLAAVHGVARAAIARRDAQPGERLGQVGDGNDPINERTFMISSSGYHQAGVTQTPWTRTLTRRSTRAAGERC